MQRRRLALALSLEGAAIGCSKNGSPTSPSTPASGGSSGVARPVYVVLFTHIEDNTPAGVLGAASTRVAYLGVRSTLIDMANLARRYGMKWVLQPDWKFLLAAQLYEDVAATSSTGGQNILRYLRDSLGVVIDPHSHESGGYNYADVAYLLDALGVGGSTVIGGHIWDPALPQFAHWERFRSPLAGQQYPFIWGGNILMGSGTPNHTNDPVVAGVWRPKNPNEYFEDDPLGNVSCVGAWKSDISGISELSALSSTGKVDSTCMLTSTYPLSLSSITGANGLAAVERDVLSPLSSLRGAGQVEITDFTSLVATWKGQYGGKACIYR